MKKLGSRKSFFTRAFVTKQDCLENSLVFIIFDNEREKMILLLLEKTGKLKLFDELVDGNILFLVRLYQPNVYLPWNA